jgi:hypothetical protein
MWEIAENLHRAELTKLERAEHLEGMAAKGAQLAHRNQQPAEHGVSKTGRSTAPGM